jgi:hypothetical protein
MTSREAAKDMCPYNSSVAAPQIFFQQRSAFSQLVCGGLNLLNLRLLVHLYRLYLLHPPWLWPKKSCLFYCYVYFGWFCVKGLASLPSQFTNDVLPMLFLVKPHLCLGDTVHWTITFACMYLQLLNIKPSSTSMISTIFKQAGCLFSLLLSLESGGSVNLSRILYTCSTISLAFQ